jgi:RimJ/RimL family protein N-acetyltransferase
MIEITAGQAQALRARFRSERAAIIALHGLNAGVGQLFVDRWPEPRVILASIGGLHSLWGDPGALQPDFLARHVRGMVYCEERFLPVLQMTFPQVRAIERVWFALTEDPRFELPAQTTFRPLQPEDADLVRALDPALHFISNTWGGPAGLAASGYGWGAFVGRELVSVSCTFLLGDTIEDVGVVTKADYRGRGLATACAGYLCREILRRGRRPTWTTSSGNRASIRVAEKVGFEFQAQEALYIPAQETT